MSVVSVVVFLIFELLIELFSISLIFVTVKFSDLLTGALCVQKMYFDCVAQTLW